MFNRVKIAKRINMLRERMNLSMQALAKLIKMSQPTVSRMMSGKQAINLQQIGAIAWVLRVHPYSLLFDEPLDASTLAPAGHKGVEPTLLGPVLLAGRLRLKLEPEPAAQALRIAADELLAVENGLARPDDSLIVACAGLYGRNPEELRNLARLDRDSPADSRRLAELRNGAAHVIGLVLRRGRADPEKAMEDPVYRAALHYEGCLEYEFAGEPPLERFVFRHLSPTLHAALQDPVFCRQAETLAAQWAASAPAAAPKSLLGKSSSRRRRIPAAAKPYVVSPGMTQVPALPPEPEEMTLPDEALISDEVLEPENG